MLPRDWAFDMLLFAQRNPQPVPLLDVTDPGAVSTVLAPGAEPTDVVDLWRDDLVAFLIGCSFSFERALTDVACRPAGRLSGPLVVSMRPIPAALVVTAVQVTARMPQVRWAPAHLGSPSSPGIADLGAPDFGGPGRPAAR